MVSTVPLKLPSLRSGIYEEVENAKIRKEVATSRCLPMDVLTSMWDRALTWPQFSIEFNIIICQSEIGHGDTTVLMLNRRWWQQPSDGDPWGSTNWVWSYRESLWYCIFVSFLFSVVWNRYVNDQEFTTWQVPFPVSRFSIWIPNEALGFVRVLSSRWNDRGKTKKSVTAIIKKEVDLSRS